MPAARSRLLVIFLTVFIDLIGFGIILPILPYYAQHFGAQGLGFGALVGAYSLMQFAATAVLGRLSDRVGRRPILLATMVLNAAGYTLFAFAGSYVVLFMARLVSGFAGGNISAAQAYIADVTSSAERSKGMGLIGMAFGIGLVFGPFIGGYAAHYGGPAAPGLVAAALSALNFVSAYFILPESLKEEHRTARELWPFGHMARALVDDRLRPLMLVWAIAPFAFSGYTVALPLWAGTTFGWRARELGVFFGVVGVTSAVVQGGLFRVLTRLFGDRALLIAGMFGMAVGIAVVPYLGTERSLYAWTILLAFSNSIMSPAATGLVSILAGVTEQGTILGAAQALAALGRFTGPEMIGEMYDRVAPTAAFLVAGAFMALGGVASLWVPKSEPHRVASPAAHA